MMKFRRVPRSREEIGELDEIVAHLFNDLASGNIAPRTVSRPGETNRSLSRRGTSRAAALSAAQCERGGANPGRGKSSEQDLSEDSSIGWSPFDRDVDDEGLLFDEEINPDKSISLSLEDKELVERMVAELASRPHAYLLLELVSDGLVMEKQKADIPLDGPAAIDGDKKPARPPGAVNPRPVSDGTET
jgi:hypothetical protein